MSLSSALSGVELLPAVVDGYAVGDRRVPFAGLPATIIRDIDTWTPGLVGEMPEAGASG